MRHVIIGAGPAGVVAAESLRKLDPSANITLIGDEPEPPYSRMAIPYLLIEKINERGTYLRKNDAHYDQLKVDVRRDRVDAIDAAAKTLQLQSGASESYDKLLIATGSRPIRPPIEGIDLPQVHNCWTLEDARAIAAAAQSGAKVVLMGAGFIGCIVLEALALRGVDLTVVEMGDRMVPRMMDDIAGNMLKSWCENKGVTVRTSTRITGISASSGPHALDISYDNGEGQPADLLICAAGVRPNMEFTQGSGIQTDQGILVNPYLETNVADIFCAGDVCQGKDFSTGGYSVQAIQPTATDHARIAATNMTEGLEHLHHGSVSMNVLDTLGLISVSFGAWDGVDGGDTATLCDQDGYKYLQLQFLDDVLVGANAVGHTQHVGVLRGLIETQARLGHWKQRLMDDPTQVMSAYLHAAQQQA